MFRSFQTVSMCEDRPAGAHSLDVLVPTRDRPTRLAAMLGSLAAQEAPPAAFPISLYLLDNGETSAFADFDVARQLDVLAARGVRTFYLRRPHLVGVYAVRRHLYETARGDMVVWIDDDVALPPGTLLSLWRGIVDHEFALAASLVLDVDGLHGEEIGYGHRIGETLNRLADQIEREDLATVGDAWMEMVSPFGTNLMFRREAFDAVGGWGALEPFFSHRPDAWGEDVGVCVALKSTGEAFVDISRVVLHLGPRQRSFTGWETPAGLAELLVAVFGADHPSGMASPLRRAGGGRAVACRLRRMAAGLAR